MKRILLIFVIYLTAINAADPLESNIEGRIIGGHDAVPHFYKFICSLQYGTGEEKRHTCGSSILNENWILTAAHCLRDPFVPEHYNVACGKWDLSAVEDGQQIMVPDRAIIHEIYANGSNPDNLPWDMALLHLSEPLVFSDTVVPTILPTPEDTWDDGAIIGWGIYDWYNETHPILPDILQRANVTIISDEICEFLSAPFITIFKNFICTGPLFGGISGCNGDSGGPMYTTIDDKIVQIGVASWAMRPCGAPNAPTGYVSTQNFLDWISDNMDE